VFALDDRIDFRIDFCKRVLLVTEH